MVKDLNTQIDNIVLNTKQRILNVIIQSISETVEESQVTVARGGKMRVKTGFLRSSGIASLNTSPTGPSKGDPKGTYKWDGESVNKVLANLKIGDVFYFGWTARYAKYREVQDGFLESAIQNWQKHVDKATTYYKNKDARK